VRHLGELTPVYAQITTQTVQPSKSRSQCREIGRKRVVQTDGDQLVRSFTVLLTACLRFEQPWRTTTPSSIGRPHRYDMPYVYMHQIRRFAYTDVVIYCPDSLAQIFYTVCLASLGSYYVYGMLDQRRTLRVTVVDATKG